MQMKAELDRRFIAVVSVQDTGVEGYQLGSRFVAGRPEVMFPRRERSRGLGCCNSNRVTMDMFGFEDGERFINREILIDLLHHVIEPLITEDLKVIMLYAIMVNFSKFKHSNK
ncbi:hypothetical protein CEXT_143551 [Caerostris extrusa]|uniref:Uncharacterized protein n=1 Tax=Caerostris extrusa TaxID=172846 RepID=A0AAV4QDR8_CAEEX|nr:hypothetical protein CEXT_143551 [Caerostris extrusa]